MAAEAGPVPEDSKGPTHDGPRFAASLHAASPILRDLLAADRTRLANERTLLSYIRTTIGFAATGIGLIYLFDVGMVRVAGAALIAASVGVLFIGVTRYRSVARDLAEFKADVGVHGGLGP